MKKIFYALSMASILMLAFTSCVDPEDKKGENTVSSNSLSFTRDGGIKQLTIKTVGAWTLSSDDASIPIRIGMGADTIGSSALKGDAGEYTINVIAPEDTSYTAISVKLSCVVGKNVLTIDVTRAATIRPSVSQPSSIVRDGGWADIKISAQWNWELYRVRSEGADVMPEWLSVDQTKGEGSGTIRITASKYTEAIDNPDLGARSAYLYFLIDAGKFTEREVYIMVSQMSREPIFPEGQWTIDFFDIVGAWGEIEGAYGYVNMPVTFEYDAEIDQWALNGIFREDDQGEAFFRLFNVDADTFAFTDEGDFPDNPVGTLNGDSYRLCMGVTKLEGNNWAVYTFADKYYWPFYPSEDNTKLLLDQYEGWYMKMFEGDDTYYPVYPCFLIMAEDGYMAALSQIIFHSPESTDYRVGNIVAPPPGGIPTDAPQKGPRSKAPSWFKGGKATKVGEIPVKGSGLIIK
jgi:hypothetical protein